MAAWNCPSQRECWLSFSLPSHSGSAELELADGLLDAVAQPLRKVGGERGPLPGADQPVERAPAADR